MRCDLDVENLDIDELIKQVGECDKQFGVKLKKKKAYNEPDKVYDVAVSEAQDYLASLVCVLNDIDMDEYFVQDAATGWYILGPIGVRNKVFRDMSCWDWDSDKRYNLSSIQFRVRFLTVFLTEFFCNIDRIPMNKLKKDKKSVGIYEYGYFYLRDILHDLRSLTEILLQSSVYGNAVLKALLLSNYKKKSIPSKEINGFIYQTLQDLEEGLSFSIMSGVFLDEDMAIYMCLRLAYVLATGSMDMEKLPAFEDIEGADTHYNLEKLIEQVGYRIMKYKKKSMFYYAFRKSRPKIRSNLKDANENLYIREGIIALEEIVFITNNRNVQKFVYEMIQDGE